MELEKLVDLIQAIATAEVTEISRAEIPSSSLNQNQASLH